MLRENITHFVIVNIFISNGNLITNFVSVTVTVYSYIILFYFLLNYAIPLHITSYAPRL